MEARLDLSCILTGLTIERMFCNVSWLYSLSWLRHCWDTTSGATPPRSQWPLSLTEAAATAHITHYSGRIVSVGFTLLKYGHCLWLFDGNGRVSLFWKRTNSNVAPVNIEKTISLLWRNHYFYIVASISPHSYFRWWLLNPDVPAIFKM